MAKKERVVTVIDGSTFMTASRKYPVRLADVPAPNRIESGVTVASTELTQMIQGRDVTVNPKGRDRYGRCVADVKVSGTSVNFAMTTVYKKGKRITQKRTKRKK